ncbi:MAG TPA: hypothetical protein VFQ23_16265 [Anaerolineales bacterium]|nr:hypothetical protein [Anaerolineales bacterium]
MKRVVPYPLLLILAVVLDRVAISSSQISIAQSIRPIIILILLVGLTLFLIQRFVKDWHYTNFIVMMIPIALLIYRSLYGFFKMNFPQQADYLALAILPLLAVTFAAVVSRRVWQWIRNPDQLAYYFNLVFIFLLGFQGLRLGGPIVRVLSTGTQSHAEAISTLTDDVQLQSKTRPDIYVIVLDGYGRQDVLRDIYDYDNSQFIHQLEERGFYVAAENHSNYVQTPYAMASLWNYDYLQPWDSSTDYPRYLLEPIQNNRVFRLLNEIGYTTVSFEGDLVFTEISDSDVYLSNFLPLNKFEGLLLVDGPFEALSNVFGLKFPIPNNETHRSRIQYELDTLHQIPESIAGPKIVYAHILATHPPFVLDQDGSLVHQHQPYSLWDGSEFKDTQDAYWNGYREQVIFTNKEIIGVVDDILAKSKAPPIILLMGDHGPASLFNWSFSDPGCLWERTSNLYALLLPGHQNDGTVYSTISPVNSFRVIFNTYFGTDFPLLEDKTFLTSWSEPSIMMDVTNKTDVVAGCTMPDLSESTMDHSLDFLQGGF